VAFVLSSIPIEPFSPLRMPFLRGQVLILEVRSHFCLSLSMQANSVQASDHLSWLARPGRLAKSRGVCYRWPPSVVSEVSRWHNVRSPEFQLRSKGSGDAGDIGLAVQRRRGPRTLIDHSGATCI
jgi:hypothetical protein